MRRARRLVILAIAALAPAGAFGQADPVARASCAKTGITLPPGFCATIFADDLGHVRQLAVAPDGTLYANIWSGSYVPGGPPVQSGFLVALKDQTGAGRADIVQHFGGTAAEGDHGGTGIAFYHGAVYAEVNDRIVRFARPDGAIAPAGPPQTILSGLPLTGDHPMHPFAIDDAGHLYVDLGSATNACQDANRIPGSPGHLPCDELATRGGIWRYDADTVDQHFSPAGRFVTGLRNGEGIAFDAAGRIFATQHGRDQLSENWPRLYNPLRGHNLPAEELVQLVKGGDYGWPECYYDDGLHKLVLAPEYGGDGHAKTGPCAGKRGPVAAFPAHWAPNDMKIYAGSQFPTAYRGGAFIAFHGSWNRAPAPQGGYNVVFQPLADGRASGPYVVFADGFAGAVKEPGRAAFRPSGLAVAPDGSLYVGDDQHGRIWRITFSGPASTAIAAAPPPANTRDANAKVVLPPEGIHPDAGQPIPLGPTPFGATPAQVTQGGRIFRGDVANATCTGCHGSDGHGTPNGSDLTSGTFLWGDGSLPSIAHTIAVGVPHPKTHTGLMPPMGGVRLSRAQIADVAAYVWAIAHADRRAP